MNPREHVAAALASGLAEEVVRNFGEIRLRVFGASMVPSILPGDLISVQRAVVSEISCGEIVMYVREGRMFVHRMVGRTDSPELSLLITRGDRLRYNDPPVSSSELLGKVISIERAGRRVKSASRPGGFAYLLFRLLRTSDNATYLYVRLASLWGNLAARTFSPRRKKGRSGTGAEVEDLGLAGASTNKPGELLDGIFGARLRSLDTNGEGKCQARWRRQSAPA
jgi:signal peptidase I